MTAVATQISPRSAAPASALAVAAVFGVASGYVIPNGPPGIGLALLGWSAAAVLWRLTPGPVRGWRLAHAVTALLLLSVCAVRDAPWLVALSLAMSLGIGSLALTPAATWPGVARGLVEVGLRLPRAVAWSLRGLRDVPVGRSLTGPLARGLAGTALVLLVFVPLLASADSVFASFLDEVLPGLPDLGLLPARVVIAVMAALGVAAGLLALLAPRPEPAVEAPRRLLASTEWLLPLLVLDGLLAAFVLLQATVLFGGDEHVLHAAGVTYASYARQGFGQLVAVTVLVLVVVGAAVRWAPRAARPWLAALCGLALVIDASALWRLHLYVDAYGLSRLRITATALAGWLGVVLVIVLIAGLRPGRWVPHTIVASAGAGLLLLALVNPDARIAASVVDQGATADLRYVATLSADAAGELRDPRFVCALVDVTSTEHYAWTSANLGRHRAAELFPSHDLICRR